MVLFLSALAILFVGYMGLSRLAEKVFRADNNITTPAMTQADGFDYVPMKKWKIFLIEFINIAGLGPVFGAIAGALFGPAAFLWIVFGSLLIGGMHDYFSAMISLRHKGATFSELPGLYLGKIPLYITRVWTIIVLMLVGVVFISAPAGLLTNLFHPQPGQFLFSTNFWIILIFLYCVAATIFPIDKIVGRFYPIFGAVFVFMGLALLFALIFKGEANNIGPFFPLTNQHYRSDFSIFPMMFVSIACGAVSGFHATQSPLMTRCMQRETPDGRQIFYGAMILEAVLALAWAAASISFFNSDAGLNAYLAIVGNDSDKVAGATVAMEQGKLFHYIMKANNGNAAIVVNMITTTWFGKVGGVLAVLGVVIAPITCADTSFRVIRMNLSEIFKIDPKKLKPRLLLSAVIFAIAIGLLNIDFAIIWRYFAFSNQTLAMIALWTAAMYLVYQKRGNWHFMLSLPAAFMTTVVTSYILAAPDEGFGLPVPMASTIGVAVALFFYTLFFIKANKVTKNNLTV